jgi:uncharacterized membrane protein YcaP (DUF421 family)
MIGFLGISYWLCRYIFFDMHGMKQWPNLLAIVSLAIIIIATISGKRIISATTVIGYIIGFILAMIFNTDGLDQGGGRINNAWKIWGAIFVLSILIGVILTLLPRLATKWRMRKY